MFLRCHNVNLGNSFNSQIQFNSLTLEYKLPAQTALGIFSS